MADVHGRGSRLIHKNVADTINTVMYRSLSGKKKMRSNYSQTDVNQSARESAYSVYRLRVKGGGGGGVFWKKNM